MPAGRPKGSGLTHNPAEIIPELIQWISEGKTLRAYSRQPGKPSYGTVYDWIEDDKEIASLFARARIKGQDAIADECVEIADTEEDPNRAKVRIWTRLQLLAKWNPKKYGEKIQQEHSGELGIKVIAIQPSVEMLKDRPALKPVFDEKLIEGE